MATVRRSREGRVLTVRLDNPPVNFVDAGVVDELHALVRDVGRDRSIGAVVLTGAPEQRFFTHYDAGEILAGARRAGMRIGYRRALLLTAAAAAIMRLPGGQRLLERSPAAGMPALLKLADVLQRMRAQDKVYLAAINGNAIGGGFALALGCDIRLIADGDFRIGIPETTLGFVVPGVMQHLSHLVGASRAMEIALEGDRYSPARAAELGLVNRVVAADRLQAEAAATAARLARRSPAVIKEAKRTLYANFAIAPRRASRSETAAFVAGTSEPSSQSALAALVEGFGGPAPSDEALQRSWEALR